MRDKGSGMNKKLFNITGTLSSLIPPLSSLLFYV